MVEVDRKRRVCRKGVPFFLRFKGVYMLVNKQKIALFSITISRSRKIVL